MSIKTILVPASGSESDDGIFESALAAATRCMAHLEFYHVIVDPCEAAANAPEAGFAMGAGLVRSFAEVRAEERKRLAAARNHVEIFCRQYGIVMRDKPHDRNEVSASWCEASGDSKWLLMHRARCSDLVVMARKTHDNHLPPDLLEHLLLQSGRPILLAPSQAVRRSYDTILVCWKDCREAAHAVTAAMPLLCHAPRIFVVSVSETGDDEQIAAADGVVRHMLWHGIHAAPCHLRTDGHAVARVLSTAAHDYGADLIVMGGYSRSRLTELIFGGCTEAFLRTADRPILLAH